jgi:hypothetical protein
MTDPVPEWVYKTYTAADPLTVEQEWTPLEALDRSRSRDIALLCIAGMVIVAVLAYLLGRASA